MSLLRKFLIIPPILIGAGLVFYAVSHRQPPVRTEIAETATTVRVITTTAQSFIPRISGFGTAAPARTWNGIAQVAGRVTYLNPNFVKGAFVRAGDVLVRLAPEDYELDIAEAQTGIASAEADIEELKATLEFKNKSLEIEKAVLDLAQKDLARKQELSGRNVVSSQTLENQQSALLQRQISVQNLETEIALIPTKLKALKQAKKKSEVQLENARLDLERTTITAPFDARVAEVNVEIDQFVGGGSTIGHLDGIDASDVEVQITPRKMAGFIKLQSNRGSAPTISFEKMTQQLSRMSATVRLDLSGLSATWQADVKRISDTVDPTTRSLGVIVSVPEPYRNFVPGKTPPLIKGMFVDVELTGPAVDGVTVLPRSALFEGRLRLADGDNRLRFEPAETLFESGDAIVLQNSLPDGTRVVIGDLSPAVEGMLLAPVEDPAMRDYLRRLAAADDAPEANGQ